MEIKFFRNIERTHIETALTIKYKNCNRTRMIRWLRYLKRMKGNRLKNKCLKLNIKKGDNQEEVWIITENKLK